MVLLLARVTSQTALGYGNAVRPISFWEQGVTAFTGLSETALISVGDQVKLQSRKLLDFSNAFSTYFRVQSISSLEKVPIEICPGKRHITWVLGQNFRLYCFSWHLSASEDMFRPMVPSSKAWVQSNPIHLRNSSAKLIY